MKQPNADLRHLYLTERARTLYALPTPPTFPERLEGMIEAWEVRRREYAAPLCGIVVLHDTRQWQRSHTDEPKGAA